MQPSQADSKLQLILLPGLDGTGRLFEPFVKEFSDQSAIRIIAYPPDKHIPFELLPDYIVPQLPVDVPLAILGESYSGPVALSLACRNDVNVHRIILVASFAKYPFTPLTLLALCLPLSWLFRLPLPDFVLRYFCFGSHTNTHLSDLLRQAVASNDPGVLAKRARQGSRVDVTGLLADLQIPCLYIAASQDKLVSPRAIRLLEHHLSRLQVKTLPGPHFILQTQTKACATIVRDFLTSTIK